jgi:sec-independent protein translocase protein TatA
VLSGFKILILGGESMFNGLFQPTHLILILVVVLILFGPGKLPEAGKAIGKTMRDMRSAFSGEEEGEQKGKATGTENIASAAAAPSDITNKPVN